MTIRLNEPQPGITTDRGTGPYGVLFSLPQVGPSRKHVRRFQTRTDRDTFTDRNAITIHDLKDPS